MSNINAVKKLSNRMLIILWSILILNPLSHTIFWFLGVLNNSETGLITFHAPESLTLPLDIKTAFIGYFISNISILVLTILTWQLIVLFRLYKKGIIFTCDNVNCYIKLANLTIAYVVFCYIQEILLGITFSSNNESFNIGVSLSDSDLAILAFGFIIRIIAKVMKEGKEIQEENSMTI